jgi:hypothetical protein
MNKSNKYPEFIRRTSYLLETAAELDRVATDGVEGVYDKHWIENLKATADAALRDIENVVNALNTLAEQ